MVRRLKLGIETKAIWDQIYSQNNFKAPFLTYNWHKTWFETLGSEFEAWILEVDGVLVPLSKTGSKVIFSGGKELADYLDLIGPDFKTELAWLEIIKYLKSEGLKELELFNIPPDSLTINFFQNQRALVQNEDTTPKIELPGSWEEYLESLDRNDRHELRRKMRNFEQEHPDLKLVLSLDPPQDLPEFLSLMKQDSKKAKFLTPVMEGFFQKIVELFKDQIELRFLEVAGKKIASTLAFREVDTIFLYNSGFDQQDYSNSGFYSKAILIKQAIEDGLKEFNFLQGGERYKYEFGGKDFLVYGVTFDIV